MANKSASAKQAPKAQAKVDEGSCGVIAQPQHYQKTMVVDLQQELCKQTLFRDEDGDISSVTVPLEAVSVMEAYFRHDSHLAQAWTYLARVGRKDDPSQEIAKAAWWLLRWLQSRGAEKELVELLQRYNCEEMRDACEVLREQTTKS